MSNLNDRPIYLARSMMSFLRCRSHFVPIFSTTFIGANIYEVQGAWAHLIIWLLCQPNYKWFIRYLFKKINFRDGSCNKIALTETHFKNYALLFILTKNTYTIITCKISFCLKICDSCNRIYCLKTQSQTKFILNSGN